MRKRIFWFRIRLSTATTDRVDTLFEPTLPQAKLRAKEMLIVHASMYERATIVWPQSSKRGSVREQTYIRHNGRVVTVGQAKAWDREVRKQREAEAANKRVQFLVTTSRGPSAIYGVIECSPLTDHDLLFLLAAACWQHKRPNTDLALHEVTDGNALLRMAAVRCIERNQFLSV